MNIIKRSGTEEVFDIDKIRMALVKANNSVVDSEQLTEEQIEDICRGKELYHLPVREGSCAKGKFHG